MKEYPQLFNSDMVKAILADRKRQTSRLPNTKNVICGSARFAELDFKSEKVYHDDSCGLSYIHVPKKEDDGTFHRVFPRHQVGDQLWVKETSDVCGQNNRDGSPHTEVIYRADVTNNRCSFCHTYVKKWTPSIFMSKWKSRIDLLISDTGIERIQDITEDDIIDEGIVEEHGIIGATGAGGYHQEIMGEFYYYNNDDQFESAEECFKSLWDSINSKKGPWDDNPWVVVTKFKRLMKGVK